MKIAIDARNLRTSTGRYIERLLHYLQEYDHRNHYVILLARKDFGSWRPTNPNFTKQLVDVPNYSLKEQLGYACLLYRLRVDLVHFTMPQQPLLYTRPAVTTVHDLNLLRITSNDDMGRFELIFKKTIFRVLLWLVARRSQGIITPSQFTKDDLVHFSRIPPSKVSVTYEAADAIADMPEAIPTLIGKSFIMYVGRAEPYKNNRRLIQAHQLLLQKHPDLRLAIAGVIDVLRQADRKWVKMQGYENIDFIGFVSDEQLSWLYKHTQAYVFPSLMEGFGLPGLEAMLAGAPVLSSKASCLPEIYQNSAHYFDPNNIPDIAQKIDEVLSDTNLRARLIKSGKAKAKTYSWKRMAQQTLTLSERTLNQ